MDLLIFFCIANIVFFLKKYPFKFDIYISFVTKIIFSFLLYIGYRVSRITFFMYFSAIIYLFTVINVVFPNPFFMLYLFISSLTTNIQLITLKIQLKRGSSHQLLEQIVVLLNLTGRYKHSLYWGEKLLAVKKNIKTLNHNLYANIKLKQYNQANEIIDEILVFNQNNSHFLNLKADILFHLANYKEAIVYYDKLLQIKPKSAEILYNKGKAYVILGENIGAEKCYKESLATNPLFVPSYTALVRLYLNQNLKENAIKVLENLKSTMPNMSVELKKEINSFYQELEN